MSQDSRELEGLLGLRAKKKMLDVVMKGRVIKASSTSKNIGKFEVKLIKRDEYYNEAYGLLIWEKRTIKTSPN